MILFADLATKTGIAWGAGETQPQLRTLDFNILAFQHGMKRNTSSALEIGAFVRRTETELILKSRRVIPGRLLAAGFTFRHPHWPEAAVDLIARKQKHRMK